MSAGKRIIVTTLQKFPVIYEEVDDTRGKAFAVIVDEAHSSQTGQSAMKLKMALADTHDALKEYAEIEGKAEDEVEDAEDNLVRELVTHGKHKNLSFFAFTARKRRWRCLASLTQTARFIRSISTPCGRLSKRALF